jgi:hypothetical protein
MCDATMVSDADPDHTHTCSGHDERPVGKYLWHFCPAPCRRWWWKGEPPPTTHVPVPGDT